MLEMKRTIFHNKLFIDYNPSPFKDYRKQKTVVKSKKCNERTSFPPAYIELAIKQEQKKKLLKDKEGRK